MKEKVLPSAREKVEVEEEEADVEAHDISDDLREDVQIKQHKEPMIKADGTGVVTASQMLGEK